MTQFENFKAMTIEQFAEWLDEYGQFDSSPWMTWFDEKYCSNCPAEHGYLPDDSGEERYYIPTKFS